MSLLPIKWKKLLDMPITSINKNVSVAPKRTAESNTLAYQLALTNNIINALGDIGHDSYLAGGAPRDWHLGKPVADLDFYVLGNVTSTASFYSMENAIDQQLEGIVEILPEPYFTDRYDPLAINLEHTFGVTFIIKNYHSANGMKIQLMITNKIVPIEHIVSAFSCSICEYYYDARRNEVLTSNLNLGYLEKQSVLVSYRERHSNHIIKMKKQFPEYKFLAFPYQGAARSSTYQPIAIGGDL